MHYPVRPVSWPQAETLYLTSAKLPNGVGIYHIYNAAIIAERSVASPRPVYKQAFATRILVFSIPLRNSSSITEFRRLSWRASRAVLASVQSPVVASIEEQGG